MIEDGVASSSKQKAKTDASDDDIELDDDDFDIFNSLYHVNLDIHELIKIDKYYTNDGYYASPISVTLPLLYVTVLWNREPITISDLRRWALSGTIPFLNTFQMMPYYIDERVTRKICFGYLMQNHEKILSRAHDIMGLFPGVEFPPIHVEGIVHRFMHHLGLPHILSRGIVYLYHKYPISNSKLRSLDIPLSTDEIRTKKTSCVLIMSYIIVAVKMCYGLDDLETDVRDELLAELPSWADLMTHLLQSPVKAYFTSQDESNMQTRVHKMDSKKSADYHKFFSDNVMLDVISRRKYKDSANHIEHVSTDLPASHEIQEETKCDPEVIEKCRPEPDILPGQPQKRGLHPSSVFVHYSNQGCLLDPFHRQYVFLLEYTASYLDISPIVLHVSCHSLERCILQRNSE